MAKQRMMLRFARWHIWLGWLVGFPILMWTVTGLVMVARPIEEIRGEDLRNPVPTVDAGAASLPAGLGEIEGAELAAQPGGAVWIVTEQGGARYRYSAQDGSVIPPLNEAEAREIALAAYAGDSALETVRYFAAEDAPGDFRRPIASWQAHFADGTNFYLEDSTGALLAVRTPTWRVYDFMWGLHIMDLETRDNTHHPILIIFAALAAIGAALGCVLMFRRRKAPVRAAKAEPGA